MIAWDDILAKGVALDDHLPVSIYKGTTKVAGWHPQTVSGEGTISLDGAYNVPPDALVIDGKCQQTVGVWGTNLITNGDFSNGITGWSPSSATAYGVADGAYTFTATATNGQIVTPVSMINGHKYYATASVRATSALVKMSVSGAGATAAQSDGVFHRLTSLITWTPATGNYQFVVRDTGTTFAPVSFDNCLLIDLTAAFGAGNEPTAEQMDAYLAAYPNSWFNGSALLTTSGTPNSPSPTYPAPITAITGDLTITAANGDLSDTVVTPLGSVELCSLPDGTKDTYDAVTGVLTKRIFHTQLAVANMNNFEDYPGWKNITGFPEMFPRINQVIYGVSSIKGAGTNYGANTLSAPADRVLFCLKRVFGLTQTEWKATYPDLVIDFYLKATAPQTIQLTPDLPVIRTGIKTLTVSANITPSFTATVKAMDQGGHMTCLSST